MNYDLDFGFPVVDKLYGKIFYKCFVCRKIEGKPFPSPVSAPLPEFRLNSEVPAFQSVGLDYCGPVYLKDGSRNVSVKAWICPVEYI